VERGTSESEHQSQNKNNGGHDEKTTALILMKVAIHGFRECSDQTR
jgi:hypothetical protein